MKPVIDDYSRLFVRDGWGWRLAFCGHVLKWSGGRGGWSLCLYRPIPPG